MKQSFLVLLIGLLVACMSSVEAAPNKRGQPTKKTAVKAKANKKKKQETSNLGTNYNFEDHGVTGQYQVPDEALARVEDEKSLSDLLGVRKHFKDRLSEASEQE